jgi:hypothetical protein
VLLKANGTFAKTGKDILAFVMLERLSVPCGAGQVLSGRSNGGGKANRSRNNSKVLGDCVTTLEQMRNPGENKQ